MSAATTPELFQVAVARDVIEAVGPDAAAFLHGQLSQDVANLAEGTSAYSLLLQPQGKVVAWLRVTRLGAERFLLDVDAGYADAVLARLNRFKLRTRCELTPLAGWTCWAVRNGAGALPAAASVPPVGGMAPDARWPGIAGVDRLGPLEGNEPLPDVPTVGTDRYAAARIDAGVPAMGHELDEDTIPAEGGQWLIDVSVSFTKGCYTGQELVARVDSRGNNTPRRLHALVAASACPATGSALRLEGAEVGVVTSAVPGHHRGLGYLKRSAEGAATVEGDSGPLQVLPLPAG